MTYYTITLLFIFLLGILIFKFWEYLRSNFLLNNEILKNLEKLNKSNEMQENHASKILVNLPTIIDCLTDIAKNTEILNIKNDGLNKQS